MMICCLWIPFRLGSRGRYRSRNGNEVRHDRSLYRLRGPVLAAPALGPRRFTVGAGLAGVLAGARCARKLLRAGFVRPFAATFGNAARRLTAWFRFVILARPRIC